MCSSPSAPGPEIRRRPRSNVDSRARYDRQQQIGRVLLVVIDAMHHRLAAAQVIGRVFDVMRAGKAARQVEAGDVDADAVTGLEQVAGRQDLDRVLVDLAGLDRLPGFARQRMPRPPRLGAFGIDGAMRGLEPAAGQFALRQVVRNVHLARPRGAHRHVRPDVFQDDDPVGVVLVDRGVEVERAGTDHQRVFGQRIGHVAQPRDLVGLRRRHLHERVGLEPAVRAPGASGSARRRPQLGR